MTAPTRACIADWLGLEPAAAPQTRRLRVPRHACTPRGPMFGGAVLAMLVCAAEQVTGRETVWAHVQFVRAALASDDLDLAIDETAAGRRLSNALVQVRRGDDTLALGQVALAVSADRKAERAWQWAKRPVAPAPHECPERDYRDPDPRCIDGCMEVRLAQGRRHSAFDGPSLDGRCLLWARYREPMEGSAGALGVLADHVVFAAWQALGQVVDAVSLDNEIRVLTRAAVDASDWILLDLSIQGIRDALGHGSASLWTQDGLLLATAGQSFRVRTPGPENSDVSSEENLEPKGGIGGR